VGDLVTCTALCRCLRCDFKHLYSVCLLWWSVVLEI